MATPFSMEAIGGQVGLGGADLKASTINTIQWALGIAALVSLFVLLVLGGFNLVQGARSEPIRIWAGRAMKAALFGLVVTLLAWSFVRFVLTTVVEVTA